jgi:multicomponent Na+:H+ antiporter subunit F
MMMAAFIALIVSMCLLLIRALMGPTLYDRVLAVNSFGTKTVLLIGLMGFVMGRPDFLDIAILYTLINFTSTIAVLKFFRYRSFQVPLARRGEPRADGPIAGGEPNA